jgi:hypothetical protein
MARNNDPIIWPASDLDTSLRQSMQRNYTDCINVLQTQWQRADQAERCVMGDTDLYGVLFPTGTGTKRQMFNFNIVNPIIQAISGQQRQSRKSSIVTPVMPKNQLTADQMTKCLYYVHKRGGVYQQYSDAFEQGALTSGLGFMYIYRSTIDDPVSGDILSRYVDMKSCLFDPFFRKHDMSDCRFWWTRQFFDIDEAAILYPEYQDEILALPRGSYKDDKFYYMPEVYQIQFPNLMAFDEYFYLSHRQANYVVDIETEECQEFEGDEEDWRVRLSMVDPQFRRRLKLIEKPRQTIRRSVIINDRTMIDEQFALDVYPVVPFLGYFNPNTPYYAYKFRGVATDLVHPQYLFNRRKLADLDILESQQQGLKAIKGALVTPDDAFNTGNGRLLSIDPKHSIDDVVQMDIHPPSPVMLQMEEMLKDITYRIAGIDPSAMGMDVDDKAGIISMMRQAATARNLQRLFDQLDESQRLCGDIMVQYIQKYWTEGKVQQVIGEEPTEEFKDKLFFKYGCKVVQGILTESQQQLALAQLIYVKKELGIDVPSENIIEELTIQNKDKLTQSIVKREQAMMQQQQQMAELQMQQMQVDNETKLSYARSQDGLAKERTAKIRTDMAVAEEKISRSKEEGTAAILNLLKAVKELQGMHTDDIAKKLEMVLSIEESRRAGEELRQPQPMR